MLDKGFKLACCAMLSKQNNIGVFAMGSNNNNNLDLEKRVAERRKTIDRRHAIRFSDALGRRSGIERRLPINYQPLAG